MTIRTTLKRTAIAAVFAQTFLVAPSYAVLPLSGSTTTAFTKTTLEGTLTGGLPTSSTFQNGGVYEYVSQVFTPSVTGSYQFGMTAAPYDPVMIFYTGGFNAATPLVNWTSYNDDGGNTAYTCGSVGYCPEITESLTAGTTYYIVVSSLIPGVTLTYPLDFYVLGAPVTLAAASVSTSILYRCPTRQR